MRTFKSEFPDMPDDISPMVDLLKTHGFYDISWHNDAMPHFVNGGRKIAVWIDYPTKEMSDVGDMEDWTRFVAYEFTLDQWEQLVPVSQRFVASDSWDDIIKFVKENV